VPDDVGGRPFQDGWEPDDDRGRADEEFASAVFDEAFVRAATIHEPSAVDRLLAAAQARAEAEAARSRGGRAGSDDEIWDELYARERPEDGYDPEDDPYAPDPYGRHGGVLRPYRGSMRWHRPVAWILAVVMGIGMVALAFSAVYRSAGGGRQDQVPQPASTGIDAPRSESPAPGGGAERSAASEHAVPPVSAVPRTP
jgi:hypothetical protein